MFRTVSQDLFSNSTVALISLKSPAIYKIPYMATKRLTMLCVRIWKCNKSSLMNKPRQWNFHVRNNYGIRSKKMYAFLYIHHMSRKSPQSKSPQVLTHLTQPRNTTKIVYFNVTGQTTVLLNVWYMLGNPAATKC